jgi:hypothetical protein
MYDFYKETHHLNMKKVVAISIIFVIIIISLILLIAKKIATPKTDISTDTNKTSTVFYSEDNSISIELSKTFNLKKYDSNLNYLLELRSENNLNIFISKEDKLQNKTLSEITEADKLAFLETFDSYSNLSDTKELSVNNNLAYTYSFHYLDNVLNKAFYLQVTWLQIDDTYYIFDIEFPLDDLAFNTNISSSVLSSFQINPTISE